MDIRRRRYFVAVAETGSLTTAADLAFMRAEPNKPDSTYRLIAEESFVAVLPGDRRLPALDPRDLVGKTFIGGDRTAESCYEVASINDPESWRAYSTPVRRHTNPLLAFSRIGSTA
jgi:DNA-binding transcriptional LysR family regulator